jgi:dipeptidyl aminopeptidase/acylaminoacyl peptidase
LLKNLLCIAACAAWMQAAGASTPVDLAAAFGAREAVREVSLSPDGSQIAFTAPLEGQGAGLYVVPVDGSEKPRRIAVASGAPERIGGCAWINSDRLICSVFGVAKRSGFTVNFNKLMLLPTHPSAKEKAIPIGVGSLVGSPQRDGKSLLVTRIGFDQALPHIYISRIDAATGIGKYLDGYGDNSIDIVADENGAARVIGFRLVRGMTYMDTGEITYRFRPQGSKELKPFGRYNSWTRDGFAPVAIDSKRNLAWGYRKQNGRLALFTKALDETGTETLVFAHPEVDVGGLLQIGPDQHVIGVYYTTDRRHVEYLDPAMKALSASLAKAIPHLPIVDIIDASADEQKLLIRASSDVDPGRYYVLDRATRQLRILLEARPELDGVTLAPMKTITYRARDGKQIPGYLTLPAGGARNLPAIVLPHGGPSARDDWGFDWLAQYYAAKGYAVLQPNFRGSAGYGDSFQPLDGYRSWRSATADIADGARWLIAQGIADPKRLAIVGWSYGGYAALQAAATEPGLFKSVVAIAPVTDLQKLLGESEGYSDHALMRSFLGSGAGLDDGSPAELADRIAAPVMLVHGKLDMNVPYSQSERMADRLKDAGHPAKFISFDTLDHQLDDSAARRQLLSESEAFLRQSLTAAAADASPKHGGGG